MNGESKYYRSKSSICAICKQKDACIASAKKSRPFTKYLIRSIHQELFDKTFETMQEPTFIGKLKERMWKIEGIVKRLYSEFSFEWLINMHTR
jgi:hypothetical protein